MQLKYVFDVVEKKETEKLSYHLRFCQLIILKRLKVKKKNRLKEEAELFAAWNELINLGLGFRDAQHLICETHDGVPDSETALKTGLMQNGCKVSDFAPYAETYQVIPLLGLFLLCHNFYPEVEVMAQKNH